MVWIAFYLDFKIYTGYVDNADAKKFNEYVISLT